jgi:cytidylate kinase
MSRSVICISRTTGATGEEIAKIVADRLGFRYVDDEIVIRAAEVAGVSPTAIAESEHSDVSTSYSQLIEQIIRETAEQGDVVIVAHGASIPLAGRADVLRVLVTASPETRARRLASGGEMDDGGARKAVEESDRARERYLERFYQVGHELPTHYDLTLNTETMTTARAARLVMQAALTL